MANVAVCKAAASKGETACKAAATDCTYTAEVKADPMRTKSRHSLYLMYNATNKTGSVFTPDSVTVMCNLERTVIGADNYNDFSIQKGDGSCALPKM